MDVNTNILLWGVGASLATEAVSWLSKKLEGTPLAGDAAQILSFGIAFIFAGWQVLTSGTTSVSMAHLGTVIAQIFAASQVWYFVIGKRLNLLQFGS